MKNVVGEFTWEGPGADGPLRVRRLADEEGEDLTSLVDRARVFRSLDELNQTLQAALGESVTLVEADNIH